MLFKASTVTGIPKRSREPFKPGPLCSGSRLLIQLQATNTHDVMHGEQWSSAAAVEHALHRESRRGATRMLFKAGPLCPVSRLRLYQQPSVWLVVMSWWFFQCLMAQKRFDGVI